MLDTYILNTIKPIIGDIMQVKILKEDVYYILSNDNCQYKLRLSNKSNNRYPLIHNEFYALQSIKILNNQIKIPQSFYLYEYCPNNWLSITEYLSGELYNSEMINRRQLYVKAFNYLSHFYKVKGDWSGRIYNGETRNISNWRDDFIAHFERDSFYLLSKNLIKKDLINDLRSHINNIDERYLCKRELVFLHGDIHLENMIITNNNFFLIDFQHAIFGDYLFDLVQMRIKLDKFESEENIKKIINDCFSFFSFEEIEIELFNLYLKVALLNELVFSQKMNLSSRFSNYKNKLQIITSQ